MPDKSSKLFKSNISAGSNVFFSREDTLWFDKDFVEQIIDYDRLNQINWRGVGKLNETQKMIVRTELRCIYAKGDPCWGLVSIPYEKDGEKKFRHKIMCTCVQGQCPRIKSCNPEYSDEDAAFWKMTVDEKEHYGNPNHLRRYFKTDLVSDEEMLSYDVFPQNEGLEYPMYHPPVIKEESNQNKEPKSKINPRTGRKMIVIGHEWRIIDNASYEGEKICEIWGYADDLEEKTPPTTKKAAYLQKPIPHKQYLKDLLSKKNQAVNNLASSIMYQKLENMVFSKLEKEIKISSLSKNSFDGSKYIILTDNPAEQAFVSVTLLRNTVAHGFDESDHIMVAQADSAITLDNCRIPVLMNTVIETGCRESTANIWKQLAMRTQVMKGAFSSSTRKYYEFHYDSNKSRWCCKNNYGISHVCVTAADIILDLPADDMMEEITFEENKGIYLIRDIFDRTCGRASKGFVEMLQALVAADEIEEMPVIIDGLSIISKNGDPLILGIGHLRFDGY